MKSWNESSDIYSSDQEEEEEEEEMIFGENDDDLEELMDFSDLPTSLFACSVHESVFEVEDQKVCMALGYSPLCFQNNLRDVVFSFVQNLYLYCISNMGVRKIRDLGKQTVSSQM